MLKSMNKKSMHTFRNMASYQSTYGKPILGSIKSYYDVLKVPRNCSGSEIKKAYIELSKKYHPDGNTNTRDPEQFIKVCEAYKVLYKPASRTNYDCGLNSRLYMVPPLDLSYTHQKVHCNWRKFQADIRSKQFRPIVGSSNNIFIRQTKSMLIQKEIQVRPEDKKVPEQKFEQHEYEHWKMASYLTGFTIVGVLVIFDHFRKGKRTTRPRL